MQDDRLKLSVPDDRRFEKAFHLELHGRPLLISGLEKGLNFNVRNVAVVTFSQAIEAVQRLLYLAIKHHAHKRDRLL